MKRGIDIVKTFRLEENYSIIIILRSYTLILLWLLRHFSVDIHTCVHLLQFYNMNTIFAKLIEFTNPFVKKIICSPQFYTEKNKQTYSVRHAEKLSRHKSSLVWAWKKKLKTKRWSTRKRLKVLNVRFERVTDEEDFVKAPQCRVLRRNAVFAHFESWFCGERVSLTTHHVFVTR